MARRLNDTPERGSANQVGAARRRDPGGAASVLAAQRMAGNRAVAGLFHSPAAGASTLARSGGQTKLRITVTADKQGKFKGSGRGDTIEAFGFHMGIAAPHDVASGEASGGRQHQTITFKKPLDGSSPQFMQAIDTNELLKTVRIEFVGTDPTGKEVDTEIINLTNAGVVRFDQDSDDGSNVETIALTYETIDMTNIASKTTSADQWRRPASQ